MSFLIYSVEDDQNISIIINKTLTKSGFEVVSFNDGNSFLNAFKNKKPDLVLLDLMLPDLSGYDIIKLIRADHLNDDIDIIILSAKHMLVDKIDGFDLGADDYIEKPFDILELISRVQARLRKKNNRKDILEIGEFYLNMHSREARVHNNLVALTNKEFKLLALFLNNINKVLTREDIFKQVWNFDDVFESRTIDNHIKSLRSKIDLSKSHIISIYGVGYKFCL